jgi:hypothetical protein
MTTDLIPVGCAAAGKAAVASMNEAAEANKVRIIFSLLTQVLLEWFGDWTARPLSKAVVGSCTGRHARRATRAFSSEVETGSRQENASNQESRAPFRFNRNGKGSRPRSKPARCPRSDRTGVRCRSTAGSWSRERLFFGGCRPEPRSGSCLRAGWQVTRCRPGSPPA